MADLLLVAHIVFVALWFGGAVWVEILVARLKRGDRRRLYDFVPDLTAAGKIFMVLSLLTAASGLALVPVGGYTYESTWVAIGVVGWLLAAVIGGAVLGPQSKKLEEAVAAGADPGPVLKRITMFSHLDTLLLLLIIVDMVVKPG